MSDAAPQSIVAAALRRERVRTGMAMAELARRAGIAKSTLSQLESGTGNPSLETLWALATALGIPASQLIEPARPRVTVIRAGEGQALTSEESDYAAVLLASSPPRTRRDVYRITANPGAPRTSEPHLPGVVEHVVLGLGRALVGPVEDPVELAPGDYVAYPGDRPHTFRALEPGTVATLLSEHV